MDQRTGIETSESVCARMVAAFRINPRDGRAIEALAWPVLYLRDDPVGSDCLLKWARWKGEGFSIREMCRERGWRPRWLRERKDAACREIARRLNGARD